MGEGKGKEGKKREGKVVRCSSMEHPVIELLYILTCLECFCSFRSFSFPFVASPFPCLECFARGDFRTRYFSSHNLREFDCWPV